jgi:hypothetical protein
MSINPPRIGPLSTSGVALPSPPCPDCPPTPGGAVGGPTCPSDQTQVFGAGLVTLWELSGVKLTADDSVIQNSQLGPPYATGNLTPNSGLFAAIIIAGYIINTAYAPGNFGSANLIFDEDYDRGGFAPESVGGHRSLSTPSGSYNSSIISGLPAQQWCSSAAIFASDGRVPTIVQHAAPGTIPGGGAVSITLPNPPRQGNLLVAWLGARSIVTGLTFPSGAWTALTEVNTDASGTFFRRNGRFGWKAVCT